MRTWVSMKKRLMCVFWAKEIVFFLQTCLLGQIVRVFVSSFFMCSWDWGNDASTRPVHVIARDIFFSNYLIHECGVTYVIIGQLLRRNPRKLPVGYNDDAISINKHFEHLTSSEMHVNFWKHKYFGLLWHNLSAIMFT